MKLSSLSSVSDRGFYVIFAVTGLALLVFIAALLGQISPPYVNEGITPYHPTISIGNIFAEMGPGPFESDQQIKKFASVSELRVFLRNVQTYFEELNIAQSNFLREGGEISLYGGGSGAAQLAPAAGPSFAGGFDGLFGKMMSSSPNVMTNSESAQDIADSDFSATNVQVAGVDEADFLKTDGRYAYIVLGNRLTIVDAYPPEEAKIASTSVLDIPQGQSMYNMFLNGDRLVIFYQDYGGETVIPEYGYAPSMVYSPSTHALIVDVSDRENPDVLKNYEVSGEYSNSRMIGSRVFLLTVSGVDHANPIIPSVRESSKVVGSPEIYYFGNPEQSFTFNSVAAIDLDLVGGGDSGALISKTFMIGAASAVHVSHDSIYIAYQQNPLPEYVQSNNKERFFKVIVPLLPAAVQSEIRAIDADGSLDSTEKWSRVSALLQDTYERLSDSERIRLLSKMQNELADYDALTAKYSQKTVIHKISIGTDAVLEYVAKGEVPGRLLNQFSMDEHDSRLRVTTTSEYSTPQRFVMENSVYVLDEKMNVVGSLEGVAPDESIYAARFMGDRLYLVTFRQVDPFFVIDLTEDDPKVLGKLKLPGYSNYLHPYDNNHIIGIGKETNDNGAQILGIKIALFDVSNPSNPRAADTYMIGGPQTESEVLTDHKALLFSKEKDVLSIPIFSPEQYQYTGEPAGRSMEPFREGSWMGFYVFGIAENNQLELRGLIEHKAGDYYGMQGSRSFYINDTLYTVTPSLIKMNDLNSMEEVNQVSLAGTEPPVGLLE